MGADAGEEPGKVPDVTACLTVAHPRDHLMGEGAGIGTRSAGEGAHHFE